MAKVLEYQLHTGIFLMSMGGDRVDIYTTSDQTVVYSVPVVTGSTYTVTMLEIGNRFGVAFSTIDPTTITQSIENGATRITFNGPSIGQEIPYTAAEDGWILIYVSNQNERPLISVVTDGVGGDGSESESVLKIVNATQLDAALKSTADAIRAKTGGTENIPWSETEGFKSAVEGITAGGDGSPIVIENVVNLVVGVEVTHKTYVTFTSECYETTGGKTLTGTIAASAGDLILATVTTRSTTTIPEGWTVLKESAVLNSEAFNQRMFLLCKQATLTGTESITINQAESARIYLNLIVAKGATGFSYHDGTEVYSDTEKLAQSITITRPNYNLLIWACTASLWGTSAPFGTWEESSGLTPICLDQSVTAPRQANFIDGTPNVTDRTFGFGYEINTPYIIDCVEVLY